MAILRKVLRTPFMFFKIVLYNILCYCSLYANVRFRIRISLMVHPNKGSATWWFIFIQANRKGFVRTMRCHKKMTGGSVKQVQTLYESSILDSKSRFLVVQVDCQGVRCYNTSLRIIFINSYADLFPFQYCR